MTAGTHILGGILLAAFFQLPIIPAAFGSVLPDIDLKKGLPFRQNRTLFNSHRGITHHIAIPIVLVFLSIYLRDHYSYEIGRYFLSFSIGYASHILLDILNPLGVPFSFKYYPRLSLKLVRSGKFGEIFVILTLVAMLIYFVDSGKLSYAGFIDKDILEVLKKLIEEVRG
ncbi:metal-dependent hydrolase [Desulfurobacterium thermolithotrophum]|uniref:metal-dependent hydrolase n=1 Tax=Desulfurobacterium thermolithotrophum TaxID=64160 RepID=UPI0013D7B37A|nr:metal-dependent hydrolase [Desulfurobacterium thermolithotrophum]